MKTENHLYKYISNVVWFMHMKSGKTKGLGPYPSAVVDSATSQSGQQRAPLYCTDLSMLCSGRAHLNQAAPHYCPRELQETAVWS